MLPGLLGDGRLEIARNLDKYRVGGLELQGNGIDKLKNLLGVRWIVNEM